MEDLTHIPLHNYTVDLKALGYKMPEDLVRITGGYSPTLMTDEEMDQTAANIFYAMVMVDCRGYAIYHTPDEDLTVFWWGIKKTSKILIDGEMPVGARRKTLADIGIMNADGSLADLEKLANDIKNLLLQAEGIEIPDLSTVAARLSAKYLN